jgi:hypothetical protein
VAKTRGTLNFTVAALSDGLRPPLFLATASVQTLALLQLKKGSRPVRKNEIAGYPAIGKEMKTCWRSSQ